MAGHDHDRAEHIWRTWPEEECLAAFEARVAERQMESYQHELTRYCLAGGQQQPKPGAIAQGRMKRLQQEG